MRDVANLAWKFSAALRGRAPALLDTYQAEREPHVRAVISAAIAAGRYICERDPAAARKRDETLRAAMGKPAPASASDLIPPVRAGIVDPDGAARPGTGARFIQPAVDVAGRRMLLDDATGGGFVLLALPGAIDGLTAAQRASFARIGRSFVIGDALGDVDGDLSAWLAAHGAAAVLLRPDFYVYGIARDAADVARWWRRLGVRSGRGDPDMPQGLIKVATAAIMRSLNRGGERMNSSTLTGLAAVLFGCGIVALFAALYRDAANGGPLMWIGFALLAATIVCWFMAARGARADG